ncbi:MAG: VIT1/CCC1 transporter family protein, partial [Methylovirgula sp.]|nr:VIT1/CCC1 transporter family protein [Methylovirgula sp.]
MNEVRSAHSTPKALLQRFSRHNCLWYEDGTVSIFGLIFGVAATTTSTKAVLIAGASGAVAAAVSMMAGVYLDAETTRDEVSADWS